MILTILEGSVAAEHAPDLQAAFEAEAANIPAGFIRSQPASIALSREFPMRQGSRNIFSARTHFQGRLIVGRDLLEA